MVRYDSLVIANFNLLVAATALYMSFSTTEASSSSRFPTDISITSLRQRREQHEQQERISFGRFSWGTRQITSAKRMIDKQEDDKKSCSLLATRQSVETIISEPMTQEEQEALTATLPSIFIEDQQIHLSALQEEDEELYDKRNDFKTMTASTKRMVKPSKTAIQQQQQQEEEQLSLSSENLQAVTQPFVLNRIWEQLDGTEFNHPRVVDTFCQMALDMTGTTTSNNGEENNNVDSVSEWIQWTPHKGNNNKKSSSEANEENPLQDGQIKVFIGTCQKEPRQEYRGGNLPVIKTESWIPNQSPQELAELLLDSSRVGLYNKLSLGRQDLKTLASNNNHDGGENVGFSLTRIVRNTAAPPLTSKKVQSTTMMHARPIPVQSITSSNIDKTSMDNEGTTSYLVISRAVRLPPSEEDQEKYGTSEILLGINLLRPMLVRQQISETDDESPLTTTVKGTHMTSITHVYSPALPVVLAKKVGVSSAVNFVKDLRNLDK